MEIMKANAQWSKRPADERYPTLQALYDATKRHYDVSKSKDVDISTLRVDGTGGDVTLVGKGGVAARLTHWSFGQLARRVGAPADYLRDLPSTLAAQNLNHGLAKRLADSVGDGIARLLFHINGSLKLSALTSTKYSRIWDYEVAERLLYLESLGWQPAVPDTSWAPSAGVDLGESALGVTALYASDHDMFAFIRQHRNEVHEAGSDQPIYKGVIVENSEVGASSLKLTRFLYRYMCGNHIIWGAQEVQSLALRHVGDIRERFGVYASILKEYAEESVSDVEAKIKASKARIIAGTKEEVLDAIFGKRSIGLSRKALAASYDAVNEEQDGDPRTVWGFVQGVTRYSQTVPFADQRTEIDKAGGRILDAF